MKTLQTCLLGAVVILLIESCSKENAKPSVAETNGVTLAGAKGSSKSWLLSSGTASLNSGSYQNLSLDACFLDNIFKFTNNSTQDYESTEGSTKCNSTDSTLVEKGSWALTNDGKSLLIDGTPYSQENLFTSLGESVTIVELTDTSLKVSFAIIDGTDTYHYNLSFVKI